MAYIIKANGETVPVTPAGKKFTLQELQAAIGGGYIEPIPGTKLRAYFDEEGRMKRLPFNAKATMQFGRAIVGDVVVLEDGDKQ